MITLKVHFSGSYANFEHRNIYYKASLNGQIVRIRQMFYSIDGADILIHGEKEGYYFRTDIGKMLSND